jgi:hypothetical protein
LFPSTTSCTAAESVTIVRTMLLCEATSAGDRAACAPSATRGCIASVRRAYTVTPSKAGFTFSPTSQPVTVNGANVTAVNFTATPIPTWSISGTVSPAANGTGTTLTLSGAASGTTTADASGNFTFTAGQRRIFRDAVEGRFRHADQSAGHGERRRTSTGINFTIQTAPTGYRHDVNVSTDQPSSGLSTVTSPTFSTTAGNGLLLAFVAGDYLTKAPTPR